MKSQADRLLAVLKDGRWHDHLELYARGMVVHSRIAELRARGHKIECQRERIVPRFGFGRPETIYRYRLVKPMHSAETERGPGATGSGDGSVVPSAGRDARARASDRADAGAVTSASSRSASAETLEAHGVDRAVAEANAEHPGLLVEPDRELTLDEQREQLTKLQESLWPEQEADAA